MTKRFFFFFFFPSSTSTSKQKEREKKKLTFLLPLLAVLFPKPLNNNNNNQVKEAFQDYIYHVITRRNPRMDGRPYSEEPAIMAWELMNEPQLSNDYDKKMGIPPGSVTSAWVREMAAFIKEADGRRHLVSVGDEGWRSDVKGGFGGDWTWINDGTKGVDAATNVNLPEIDFMTLHVYAPNWGFSADKYQWLLQNFVADRAALAAVANKPIVLEVRACVCVCVCEREFGERVFFFFGGGERERERKREKQRGEQLSALPLSPLSPSLS